MRPSENAQFGSEASQRSQNLNGESQSAAELQQTNHAKTLRPSENVQLCSRSKKEKILTTPVPSAGATGQADIQKVFRGLKFESDNDIGQKGTFSEGSQRLC